ncbi:hypothetical protein GCM10008939_10960 [Deinococcus aquiradiocola]|uniref:Uncharacterized protein n=1 Tax=Deinococcus aquiradiocola TaxID=393059 RepID=A0A917PAE9_9DEIO|nr:hypothetical protein GCM10008939_10960 [Deinococcus aquiradiocola]
MAQLASARNLETLLVNYFEETVVSAFQLSQPSGFGDASVAVTLLPGGAGRGAASEVAAELLHGFFALLSVLEESNDLLFGKGSCVQRSSSLSGAHKGFPCAPPGEIRMTLISFVRFQGGTPPLRVSGAPGSGRSCLA